MATPQGQAGRAQRPAAPSRRFAASALLAEVLTGSLDDEARFRRAIQMMKAAQAFVLRLALLAAAVVLAVVAGVVLVISASPTSATALPYVATGVSGALAGGMAWRSRRRKPAQKRRSN